MATKKRTLGNILRQPERKELFKEWFLAEAKRRIEYIESTQDRWQANIRTCIPISIPEPFIKDFDKEYKPILMQIAIAEELLITINSKPTLVTCRCGKEYGCDTCAITVTIGPKI